VRAKNRVKRSASANASTAIADSSKPYLPPETFSYGALLIIHPIEGAAKSEIYPRPFFSAVE
jgi:hypothetical protein